MSNRVRHEKLASVTVVYIYDEGRPSLQDVMNATTEKIEFAAQRRPPFGIELIQKAAAFLRSAIVMEIVPIRSSAERSTFAVQLAKEKDHESNEWAPASAKAVTYTLIAFSSGESSANSSNRLGSVA